MSEILVGVVGLIIGVVIGASLVAQGRAEDCLYIGKWRYGDMVFECHPVEKAK